MYRLRVIVDKTLLTLKQKVDGETKVGPGWEGGTAHPSGEVPNQVTRSRHYVEGSPRRKVLT